MVFFLTAVTMAAAVIFGGATRLGFAGDVAAQMCAAFLFAAVLMTFISGSRTGQASPRSWWSRAALVALPVVLIALLALVQLLPLRSSGVMIDRFQPAGAFSSLGAWYNVSLTPYATASSLVSLMVPIAVFAAVLQLAAHDRIRIAWLVVALGALSLGLSFVQVAQGTESPLRFFEYTNPTEAVGFFANRNHFAALMYVTLVMAAALVIHRFQHTRRMTGGTTDFLLLAVGFVLIVSIVAGLALARSRAGMGLAMVALIGIAAMALRLRLRQAEGRYSLRTFINLTLGFAVLFALQFGLARVMSRFDADPLEDLRWPLSQTTIDMVKASWPWGTGVGSFVPVYAAVESQSVLHRSYSNRAHNDLVEWLLEAGLPGALLIGLFLVWFVWQAWRVWRPSSHDATVQLQRAAILIIALLLAHSLVDYPLRTTAMMAVFAFACALLMPTSEHGHDRAHEYHRGHDQGRSASKGPPQPNPSPIRQRRRPWGENVNWPEGWQPKLPKDPSAQGPST